MKTLIYLTTALLLFTSCQKQEKSTPNPIPIKVDKEKQEAIIKEYLENGAWKHGLYSREWQEKVEEGLQQDSTIAYLWQQKAMPLFKQGKYEVGMEYIDKAVIYNRARWQDYRAFIKCIFAKTYKEAILDFEDCKKRVGNSIVMDHSYDFYIAVSYLQLNEFEKAENLLKNNIEKDAKEKGEDWVHHLDLFYYGISLYEQKKYEEAIVIFDRALALYSNFSDVQYYKAMSIWQLGDKEDAKTLFTIAEKNGKNGYTINDDNVIYERYPYQVRWH